MSEQADRDALAEVLGEHSWDMTDEIKVNGAWTWVLCCECGDQPRLTEGHQHIADAILASDWLAQRDRRVAAEALREAADGMVEDAELWHAGAHVLHPADVLRERADRIERGERWGNSEEEYAERSAPKWGTEDYRRWAALFNDIARAPCKQYVQFGTRHALTAYLWEQGWRREVRPEDVTG